MESRMPEALTVKAKTLAAEARILRHAERKALRAAREASQAPPGLDPEGWHARGAERRQRALQAFSDLHCYRVEVVRAKARTTHLTRAYLAGMPYRAVEVTARRRPNLRDMAVLVQRYGVYALGGQPLSIEAWLTADAEAPEPPALSPGTPSVWAAQAWPC